MLQTQGVIKNSKCIMGKEGFKLEKIDETHKEVTNLIKLKLGDKHQSRNYFDK